MIRIGDLMKQLSKWCKRVFTTQLFFVNRVEHPEWSGWRVKKYIIDGKLVYILDHGLVSHSLVIYNK